VCRNAPAGSSTRAGATAARTKLIAGPSHQGSMAGRCQFGGTGGASPAALQVRRHCTVQDRVRRWSDPQHAEQPEENDCPLVALTTIDKRMSSHDQYARDDHELEASSGKKQTSRGVVRDCSDSSALGTPVLRVRRRAADSAGFAVSLRSIPAMLNSDEPQHDGDREEQQRRRCSAS